MKNHTRRTLLSGSAALVPLSAKLGLAREPASTYAAYEIGAQKGFESLALKRRPITAPGANEVLIRVRASALNNRDLRIMSAGYGGAKVSTRIPLGDGAGDVVALGAGVTDVSIGDRVTACHYTHWTDGELTARSRTADLGSTVDGWLADFAIMPVSALVKIPPIYSYEEAACFPIAAATVWNSIVTFAQTKGGETLLTLGTGGVSTMSLQLGRILGARVAITSSSDEKLERMRAMGAEILVNYAADADWDKTILKATSGVGVNVVIETRGPETLPKTVACCALNGRIACLTSIRDPQTAPPDLTSILGKNLVIKGMTSGNRAMLDQALRAFATNGVRPVIDKVFEFPQARDAYDFMASGNHVGKVVISHG